MDHTVARKRPSSATVHKYIPYLAHQAGYQIFRATYGAPVLCIDTSRQKWNLWTSHPWARSTDMPSKSSRRSNKRCDNLGLGTPHRKIQEREPQPTEQRTEKRWIVSGKLVQATSKEGHQKEK
jgi:hypothetical protein